MNENQVTIKFDSQTDLETILHDIKYHPSENIVVTFAEGSPISQSDINLEIIKKYAQKEGKNIKINQLSPSLKNQEDITSSKPKAEEKEKEKKSEKTETDSEKEQKIITPENLEPQKKKKNKIIIFILIALFVTFLTGSVAYVYLYLPRAEITLFVESSEISQENTLTIDPQTTNMDLESLTIPGEKISVQLSTQEEFNSTGEKMVGKKSSGQVVIYNKTNVAVTQKSGTELTSLSNPTITFILMENVTINPKSTRETIIDGSPGEESVFGQSESLLIEAYDIGSDYNLPANSTFSLEGHTADELYAISVLGTSGGETETLTIISSSDQQLAQSQLLAQISADNRQSLEKQVQDTKQLLTETISHQLSNIQFSQAVGTQVSSFSATATVISSGITFDREEVRTILKQKLKQNTPEGYTLDEDTATITIEPLNISDNQKITIMGIIRASVIPQIDQKEIIEKIKSRPLHEAEKQLKNLTRIDGYQINLWPHFPERIQRIPFKEERISIIIQQKN